MPPNGTLPPSSWSDPPTRSFVYASAGHMPGYILDPSGKVKAVLQSTGLPLAVLPDGDFNTVSTPPLEPGELLLFITDGMVEAHVPDGDVFGIERVLNIVHAHRHQSAREIVDTLYTSVRAFCGFHTQLDDMTAIVIKAA